MKKVLTLIVILSLVTLSGCGSNSNTTVSGTNEVVTVRDEADIAKISELEGKVSSLESQVTDLKDLLAEVTADRDTLQAEKDAITAESTVEEGDVVVILTKKTNIPKDTDNWQFNDLVAFTFSIQNNTDKNIQGIQGKLNISDLFGVTIMNVGCDFTGEIIEAKKSVINDTLSFEVNEFIDNDTKLYNTDFKDLMFNYTVTKIVFEDGTIKE